MATMKVLSFPRKRREPREEQTATIARALVQSFQQKLHNTFVLADGGRMNLLNAQRILCRYWEFEDQLQQAQAEHTAQLHEVAVLEDEERFISCELFLARRKLALLECPFAELDLVEHSSGLRGWVVAVDWAPEGFLAQVDELGRQDQPLRTDNVLYLWGPTATLGWRKQGAVSLLKAINAGWVERPI
jgi:hypothetical protein